MFRSWTPKDHALFTGEMTRTVSPQTSGAGLAPVMVVGAMGFVQLGVALSLPLAERLGSSSTAWLRLLFAAVFIMILTRAPWRSFSRAALLPLIGLGVATAGMTGFYLAAAQRIDLGLASAIEFLGPLCVAVALGTGRSRFIWPALAAAGVVCMTEPWQSSFDPTGFFFALAAGAGWAGYIIFTKQASGLLPGSQTLAFSLPIAALVMTLPGISGPGMGNFRPGDLLIFAALALINPVLPLMLELSALRRMKSAVFGTMMSMEPAIALLVGVLILSQSPSMVQVLGIGLVITATIATQLRSRHAVPAPRIPQDAGV